MKMFLRFGFLALVVGCGGEGGTVTPDAGTTQVGLVDLVTDMVQNHTDDTGRPVTIDDKQIADTDDPAAFNSLLGI